MGTRYLLALFLVLLALAFGAGITPLLGFSQNSRPGPVQEDIPDNRG
uniref:Apolipoprotein C2 n=1 Tax=Equus caballus TaxID=9796 RepID=F7A1W7_HORSE